MAKNGSKTGDSALSFDRSETRKLVDFFDESGDGSIDLKKFDMVIKALRKMKTKSLAEGKTK